MTMLYDRFDRNRMFVEEAQRYPSVLELGCSNGFLSKLIQEGGTKVVGVEIDQEAAAEAKKVCDQVFLTDLNRRGWAEMIDQRFDLVTLGDVLEHLIDPVSTLGETTEVLKPGGRVLYLSALRRSLDSPGQADAWEVRLPADRASGFHPFEAFYAPQRSADDSRIGIQGAMVSSRDRRTVHHSVAPRMADRDRSPPRPFCPSNALPAGTDGLTTASDASERACTKTYTRRSHTALFNPLEYNVYRMAPSSLRTTGTRRILLPGLRARVAMCEIFLRMLRMDTSFCSVST